MGEPILLIVIPLAGAGAALAGKLTGLRRVFTVLALSSFAGMAGVLGFQYADGAAGGAGGGGAAGGELKRPADCCQWPAGAGAGGDHGSSFTGGRGTAGGGEGAGAALYTLGGFEGEPGIAMVLSGSAWLASVLIVLIGALTAVFSLGRREFDLRYYFFLLMMTAGMETVVLTGDIFTMFVGLEVVALAAYVLIAWERSGEGLLASLKYLFLSSASILFFLFGVFVVYRDFGSLSFEVIARRVGELGGTGGGLGGGRGWGWGGLGGGDGAGGATGGATGFAVAALCVGIGVRTAFIPFHTWLPEAHAWAPHPISALLSGVLIKISFLAMFRILDVFSARHIDPMLMWLGAVTAIAAVGWALAQSDVKKLLAYHSISQMGYILAAAGASSVFSLPASFSHAVNHALFKSLLFLGVGEAIVISGERNLFRMGGLARRSPITAAAVVIGALGITGLPPFNGFVSKQLIGAAMEGSPAYVLLRLTAVGTAASFIKLCRITLPGGAYSGLGAALGGERQGERHRLAGVISIPLIILSVLVLLSGIFGRFYTLFLWRTAGGGPNGLEVPGFFKVRKIVESVMITGLGAAVYRLVMTPAGRRISDRVKRTAPRLRTVLILFVFGLVLFSMALEGLKGL